MFSRLRRLHPRLQNIQLLPSESTLAIGTDTMHNRLVLLKALPHNTGAWTIYNHLQCQSLNLCAPRLYHCHNFDDIVITECEYIPGKDLLNHINDSPDTDHPVMLIMKQLLVQVESYQKHGLSHLDIKPENIVWNPRTKKIRMIDFEAMRTHSAQGSLELGAPLGTSNYMSPEVIFSSTVHRNTDLWSVGLVGYALAMKYNPLQKKTTTRRELQCYARKRMHKAGTNPQLVRLVTSLLHFDPEQRSSKPKKKWWEVLRTNFWI